jgi:outer membrane protein
MNKNISVFLNVVLLISIAILYYLHFSSINKTADATSKANDSIAASKPIVRLPKDIKSSKIVYVNLDELSNKYEYLKDVSKSVQAEQHQYETQYQTAGQKLQTDYQAFQEKADKGLLSENQIKTEQEAFAKRKEDLDQIQRKSAALEDKVQAITEEARKNLTDYIKEYNKAGHYNYVLGYSEGPLSPVLLANDSFDITNEILDGLNAQYNAKKKK